MSKICEAALPLIVYLENDLIVAEIHLEVTSFHPFGTSMITIGSKVIWM